MTETADAERCAVPNCNSSASTGIPFPKKADLQEKWLRSLKIPNFVPTRRSFVCLGHFGEGDVLECATDLENVLLDLPIPVVAEKKLDTLEQVVQSCEIQSSKPSNSEVTKKKCLEDENRAKADEDCAQPLICRLCMSDSIIAQNIFEECEEDLTVANLITRCIPQIKVSHTDNLSKWICQKCLDILTQFNVFRSTCLQVLQRKKPTKRKNVELAAARVKKRRFDLVTAQTTSNATIKVRSDLDQKFDNVEAEIFRALEERIPEEMRNADNIIIEVQSDDESDQSVSVLSENVVKVGSDEVRLPKGIKVSVNSSKTTPVCTAQPFQEIENSEFCLVENYVFEYRLCKGSVRQLRCVFAKCRATAEQNTVKPGVYENQVWLKTPHNHPVPSEDERKTQMFLHLMRRKMQNDKSLNFRNVYEEFCEGDPEIRRLVPLKTVINQICCQQMNMRLPPIDSFDQFYDLIENDEFQKLHFTHSNSQFYQERFAASDGCKAVIFANCSTIERIADSKIMYVDASFKIDTTEPFTYHLVSALVWVTDSYYPIMFALVNEKSQEIYNLIFHYLHDTLAPKLRPEEIVTDYEGALYYSLGEVYLDSHIGGSVFYYTQNLYKKICSLNLSRELETNSCFRNIYHMLLMLPLLPVNTILDGLKNIEQQSLEMNQDELAAPIFEYVKSQWITRVTPDLFCVHRLENRINENVIAPFKKLRDFIMLSNGKMHKHQINIISVVEKLIELEEFLSVVYSAPSKKSFARDLSSSQKKNVIRAWQFIESHPKININNFFTKVLGYIKCMENQLWIWGFYRYNGPANDELINAANFSIVNTNGDDDHNYDAQSHYINYVYPPENGVVVDIVLDQKDGFVVKAQVPEEMRDNFQNSYI